VIRYTGKLGLPKKTSWFKTFRNGNGWFVAYLNLQPKTLKWIIAHSFGDGSILFFVPHIRLVP